MNALTPLLENFLESVYPDINPETRHAMERAFYVGAAALIQAQQDSVDETSELKSKEALNDLIREVQRAITRLTADYADPSLN
jgi:hypothetical protein